MSSISHEQQQQNEHAALNERVKQAFPITDEDLAMNRAGQMTEAQQAVLSRNHSQASNKFFGFVVLAVIFSLCILMTFPGAATNPRRTRNRPVPSPVLFIAIAGAAGLLLLFRSMSVGDDVKNKRVMSIKGPVTHIPPARVMVGAKTFEVSRPIYESFVEGKTYILYYTAISETLIAAEHEDTSPSPQ